MELSLKEKIIFAKYKDRPIDDFEKFREKISAKVGFLLSDNLIRKLRIYQKKKSLSQPRNEYNPNFYDLTPHKRLNNRKRLRELGVTKRLTERLENQKNEKK